MDLITEGFGIAAGLILILLLGYGFIFVAGIAMYVLRSLGLYTLAQRRGIKKPWMAWVPVLCMWTLGSLSDQYQYVVKHRFRSRRKVLLGLGIGTFLLSTVYSGLYTGGLVNLISRLPQLESPEELLYLIRFQPILMAAAGVSAVMSALSLLSMIFRYVCLYDIFASCSPDKKVLFTVLSILLSVTQPFFLFACRNKDNGMPPRKLTIEEN